MDADREESFSFDVEPELGEEHEKLGGLYFERVVLDLAPELMEEEVVDPMGVEDDLRQQDPMMETELEYDRFSEDDPASCADPDWIPLVRS